MNKTITLALLSGSLVIPALARAADHADAPGVRNDPAADITDVYAWPTDDNSRLNLIMSVIGPSAFSDQVQYVFHIESSAGFGMAGTTTTILCRFDTDQTIECWAGDETYLTGDASSPTGLATASGDLRVFAGPRNDPFFFNLSGFEAAIATVQMAAPNLSFDPNGCPTLDAATSQALVTQLASEPGGAPALDDFAGGNVLSIAVSIDRSLVTAGGDTLAVWGSTRR